MRARPGYDDLPVALVNLLEPLELVRAFQSHPPEGFTPLDLAAPAFATRFDLSTTLEPALRRSLSWVPAPKPMTAFVGTTVSEYALFPAEVAPEELVRSLVGRLGAQYSFVIIKDIPGEPLLVGGEAFAYTQALTAACHAAGFELMDGQALAYVPIDFGSTDAFLNRLSHARRKNLRRKLREGAAIEVEAIQTGDPRFGNDAFIAEVYRLYCQVYAQSEIHFDLLSKGFFRAVLRSAEMNATMFRYRTAGTMIGWNLCFERDGMLIDKYIGFDYPAARAHHLYTFSWFRNLQHALDRGLRMYVAGWTDPEIKRQLGARLTPTLHAVRARNPLLRAALRRAKRWFEPDRRWTSANDAPDRS